MINPTYCLRADNGTQTSEVEYLEQGDKQAWENAVNPLDWRYPFVPTADQLQPHEVIEQAKMTLTEAVGPENRDEWQDYFMTAVTDQGRFWYRIVLGHGNIEIKWPLTFTMWIDADTGEVIWHSDTERLAFRYGVYETEGSWTSWYHEQSAAREAEWGPSYTWDYRQHAAFEEECGGVVNWPERQFGMPGASDICYEAARDAAVAWVEENEDPTREWQVISKTTDMAGTAGTMVMTDRIRAELEQMGGDSVDIAALVAQSFPSKEDYVYGDTPETPVTLVQMKGKAYDDPAWEQLLNQTKLSEQHITYNNPGYGTKAIEAIQKPKTYEYDGPAGVSNFITSKSGFGYPNTILLSMNRIGTTWTGNHLGLMTNVAWGEWGFEGLFLTDYLSELNPKMSDKYLAAGGNLILATTELKLSDVKANWCRAYLRENTHRVLWVEANSLAMNGLGGEDVKFEVGTPVYKIVLWILIGLLAAYLIYSVIMMVRYGRMSAEEFSESRKRTAKARRIKNIVLAVVLAGLAAYLLITYLPVLQKAFLI